MSNRQVELAAAAALGAMSMALVLQLLCRKRDDDPAQAPARASFATKKEKVVLVTGGRYARGSCWRVLDPKRHSSEPNDQHPLLSNTTAVWWDKESNRSSPPMPKQLRTRNGCF